MPDAIFTVLAWTGGFFWAVVFLLAVGYATGMVNISSKHADDADSSYPDMGRK